MNRSKTTFEEILPPLEGSHRLVQNNTAGRSNNIVRWLLLFCIFGIIARQTLLLRGRSLSDVATVDAFAAVDIGLVWLAALIVIFSGNLGRTWARLRRTPVMWLGGYYIFCGVSCLWSALPVFSLYRAIEFLVLLSATLTIVAQYKDFVGAERGFCRIAMMTIVLEMCVTIRFFGFTLSPEVWHNTTYTVSSVMLFCYCFGEYLAMTKAERAAAKKRSRRLRRFGIFALCTLALGSSSGSNIAGTAGCLLIFLVLRRYWLWVSGLVIGLLLVLWGQGEGMLHKLLLPGKSEIAVETVSGRASLWEFLWHQFLKSPALGYGFGLTGVVSKGIATHSHNSLFSVLIGTGLVGFVPFALFALQLWWIILVRVWRRGIGIVGSAGALAAAFVNSMSLNVMADRWITSSMVFVWLLGLLLLHIRDYGSTFSASERSFKDITAEDKQN